MSNICDFDRILITECNLQHLTRNCRIKNFDEFERDEADVYLWRTGLVNVKEKGITIRYIMKWCLVMFLRRGKVNVAQYWWNIVENILMSLNTLLKSHEIKNVGPILVKPAPKKMKNYHHRNTSSISKRVGKWKFQYVGAWKVK